jgi:hypothetical protein
MGAGNGDFRARTGGGTWTTSPWFCLHVRVSYPSSGADRTRLPPVLCKYFEPEMFGMPTVMREGYSSSMLIAASACRHAA